MQTGRLFLKSGAVVEFQAEQIRLETGFEGLGTLRWKNGTSRHRLVRVRLEQVDAITVEDHGQGVDPGRQTAPVAR